MAIYKNSQGQEVTEFWYNILRAGRAIGRIGKETGRAIGQIFNKITKNIYKALKAIGPEAMQILYGLVIEAAKKNLSGNAKFKWVISQAEKLIPEEIERLTTTEINTVLNGVVLDLKKSNKID